MALIDFRDVALGWKMWEDDKSHGIDLIYKVVLF